jgi:hypothetical protein
MQSLVRNDVLVLLFFTLCNITSKHKYNVRLLQWIKINYTLIKMHM